MSHYLSKVLKLVAVLLVAGMIFHDVAAAAHPAFCPDEHEHSAATDKSGDTTADAETPAAASTANGDPHEDTRGSAAKCHSVMIGCAGCLIYEAAGISAPAIGQATFPHTSASFSSIQPGAAHRPPITVA